MDYATLTTNSEQQRSGHARRYIQFKRKQYPLKSGYYNYLQQRFSSEFMGAGVICDMSTPNAIQNAIANCQSHIQRLQTQEPSASFFTRTLKHFIQENIKIKILIMGHGRHGEAGGIVDSADSTSQLLVPTGQIVDDILSITQNLSANYTIDWFIKLCICYAGRSPLLSTQSIQTYPSRTQGSLSDNLGHQLSQKGLLNFVLTSYFTPVAISEKTGHLTAWTETDHQRDVQLRASLMRAQHDFRNGYLFWLSLGEQEDCLPNNSINSFLTNSCSAAISRIFREQNRDIDIFSQNLQTEYQQKFFECLHFLLEDSSLECHCKQEVEEQIRSMPHLNEILFYRFIDYQVSSIHYATIQKANKSILIYKNGQQQVAYRSGK